MTSPEAHLIQTIATALGPDVPKTLGVAVSGGSDSLGLLTLLRQWRDEGGPALRAVTVDHGLRAESAKEARDVAALCADWNIPHSVLAWGRSDETGNLSDQARRARYRLMAEWAVAGKVDAVALGHTRDDIAETFLMRLARSSGVDGLAAMRDTWEQDGARFVRPALNIRREDLRDVLRRAELRWVEDPSNEDPTYDRAKARTALPLLADLGIGADQLAETAGHLAAARKTLDNLTIQAARQIARIELGDVVADRTGFPALDPEIARRLVLQCLQWISGADYPPRAAALERVLDDIHADRPATLQGVYIYRSLDSFRFTREAGALADTKAQLGALWDGRWQMTGPAAPDAHVAILGERGLAHCPDRAQSPLPAASLRATPALWQGETLLSAPLAGLSNGWQATLHPRSESDFASRITH